MFIVAACSASPSPHAQLAAAPPRLAPAPDAQVPSPPPPAPDAAPATPIDPHGRGDCAAGTCTGRCVDTTRLGELCARACTTDSECATADGYVCDREWHACLLPNVAVITPKQCPTQTPARDPGFGDSNMLPDAPSAAALLGDDGSVISAVPWSSAYADEADCREDQAACAARGLVVTGRDPKTRAKLVHVLYGGDHGLRARTSRDGGTTFTTGPIVLAGTNASAVAASDGRLHVISLYGGPLGAFGSAQYGVEYTVSSDGGATFTTPVRVSARDEMLPYFFATPVLAVDVRRRWRYAAYVRGGRDGRWDIVLAASKDGGATWKRTTLAGDGCAIHMVPAVAVDPRTGTLHVAYYDSEGAPGRFVHASCGPGVTKCKIHGAINSVPFATLTTSRQPSKTIGDIATLLVDDKRRVLHAVWAQRVDEAGTQATRIFHGQAKLKK